VGQGRGPLSRTLEIDPKGRVDASEEARQLLADRAGRFVLLPSTPDLVLLARTPALGTPAPTPRCVLAGDLAAFPITDFLAFIDTTRLSGLLTISTGGVERTLAFKSGEVQGARSQASAERVGDVALRLGLVTREQLAAVEAGSRKFGAAMIEGGLLSHDDLRRCFREQVAAVFHSILVAQSGSFWLMDDPAPDIGEPLAMSTQALLMDGIRRIDEMSVFVTRIPSTRAVVRRRAPHREVALGGEEQELLDRVDGRSTVSELARVVRISEFDAMKVLYHLAEAGYVEAVESAYAPARAPADVALADLVRAANAALRHVAAVAAGHGQLERVLAALRAFVAQPRGRFAPLLGRVPVGPDGALDETALLGNLALVQPTVLRNLERSGSAERYLRDALRETVFLALLELGERLPRDADEALSAEVKRLAEPVGGVG
jgi:Domain of unknown function (DUF4388)